MEAAHAEHQLKANRNVNPLVAKRPPVLPLQAIPVLECASEALLIPRTPMTLPRVRAEVGELVNRQLKMGGPMEMKMRAMTETKA